MITQYIMESELLYCISFRLITIKMNLQLPFFHIFFCLIIKLLQKNYQSWYKIYTFWAKHHGSCPKLEIS